MNPSGIEACYGFAYEKPSPSPRGAYRLLAVFIHSESGERLLRSKSAVRGRQKELYEVSAGLPGLRLHAGEREAVRGGALPPMLFPVDNWWSLDISSAPVDPNSESFIAFINNGSPRRLHPDFGGNAAPGSVEIYGFPYVVVDSSQPKKPVTFLYASESDGAGIPFYPIPDEAITQPYWIEGGQPGNVDLRDSADRHMLIVDKDNHHLYELYTSTTTDRVGEAARGHSST